MRCLVIGYFTVHITYPQHSLYHKTVASWAALVIFVKAVHEAVRLHRRCIMWTIKLPKWFRSTETNNGLTTLSLLCTTFLPNSCIFQPGCKGKRRGGEGGRVTDQPHQSAHYLESLLVSDLTEKIRPHLCLNWDQLSSKIHLQIDCRITLLSWRGECMVTDLPRKHHNVLRTNSIGFTLRRDQPILVTDYEPYLINFKPICSQDNVSVCKDSCVPLLVPLVVAIFLCTV